MAAAVVGVRLERRGWRRKKVLLTFFVVGLFFLQGVYEWVRVREV